ncbi:MAG: hypothetical protein A2Z95_04180 [Gallionellales bacterium GWA2_60_18]|nr:MAG: hypothetical protein A2Z95_04180 [Gallionellales bacterium GWA2_60_18]
MRFFSSDFPLIQWSIVSFGVAATISLVVVFGSSEYAGKSVEYLRNAQSQLSNARNRLAAAQEDRGNMATFAEKYGTLQANKIIGDEQRLDWIEGMEAIRRQNLVTDFRYTIAPQGKYAAAQPIDSGNFDIHYSEMKLQFELLHEGQLLDFFSALRSRIKGWYQLDGCTMHRGGDEATTQLTAECSGGWITLKNRNEPK